MPTTRPTPAWPRSAPSAKRPCKTQSPLRQRKPRPNPILVFLSKCKRRTQRTKSEMPAVKSCRLARADKKCVARGPSSLPWSDVKRCVRRNSHQRANQKCVDAGFDHATLILPEDIRRKATAPSKKPRQTLSEFPANPSAAHDPSRGALSSLPCSESALAQATASGEAAAAPLSSAPAKRLRIVPSPSWQFPGYPGRKPAQAEGRPAKRPRYRKRRTQTAAAIPSQSGISCSRKVLPEKSRRDRSPRAAVRSVCRLPALLRSRVAASTTRKTRKPATTGPVRIAAIPRLSDQT